MTTVTAIKKKPAYKPRYVYGQQALLIHGRRQADAAFKAWESAKTKPQKIAAGMVMAIMSMPAVVFVGLVIHNLASYFI